MAPYPVSLLMYIMLARVAMLSQSLASVIPLLTRLSLLPLLAISIFTTLIGHSSNILLVCHQRPPMISLSGLLAMHLL